MDHRWIIDLAHFGISYNLITFFHGYCFAQIHKHNAT